MRLWRLRSRWQKRHVFIARDMYLVADLRRGWIPACALESCTNCQTAALPSTGLSRAGGRLVLAVPPSRFVPIPSHACMYRPPACPFTMLSHNFASKESLLSHAHMTAIVSMHKIHRLHNLLASQLPKPNSSLPSRWAAGGSPQARRNRGTLHLELNRLLLKPHGALVFRSLHSAMAMLAATRSHFTARAGAP